MNEQEMIDMKLNTISRQGEWDFLRVVGGWIYTKHRLDNNQMNSVFVPEKPNDKMSLKKQGE